MGGVTSRLWRVTGSPPHESQAVAEWRAERLGSGSVAVESLGVVDAEESRSMTPRCELSMISTPPSFSLNLEALLITMKPSRRRPRVVNLGISAWYDAVDGALGRLRTDDRSEDDAHSDAPSVAESDGARTDAGSGSTTSGNGSGPDDSRSSSTLAVTKFASLRGASVYFCRDEECYRCSTRQKARGRNSNERDMPHCCACHHATHRKFPVSTTSDMPQLLRSFVVLTRYRLLFSQHLRISPRHA